jgi:XTP/dITP diphosphohydrolase
MPQIDLASLDPARTVVVATGNAHKLTEIQAILGAAPSMADMRFVALGALGDWPDPEEDGETFCDNALIKARAALDDTGLAMAVADDSGLCVDALGGDPGIHSARWAGEHGNDAANNELLLEQLAAVPDEERTARFHSCVVLVSRDEDGEEVLVGEGDCEGTIAHDLRGTNGFGYDPLFELADIPGRRMAELEPEEKNAISHRRRALDDLVAKLAD